VRKLSFLLLSVPLIVLLSAASRKPPSAAFRFEAVDIFADPQGKPLAAYQFELSDVENRIKIVGVEGGTHPAFSKPPYYDPKALRGNRIIVAAFNTGSDLPVAETRIARIHVMIRGKKDPDYILKPVTAASPDGTEIPVRLWLSKSGETGSGESEKKGE